jgi:hypothetical protein
MVLAIDLSTTVRKIKENLFSAFIYDIALIPIAGVLYPSTGIVMNPIYAAIAIASSSITVLTDSMLMKRYEPKILKSGVRRRRRTDLEQQKEYDKSSTSLASTKYTTQDQQLQQQR